MLRTPTEIQSSTVCDMISTSVVHSSTPRSFKCQSCNPASVADSDVAEDEDTDGLMLVFLSCFPEDLASVYLLHAVSAVI